MGSCLSLDSQRGSPMSAEAAASRKQRRGVKKRLSRASSDNKRDEQLHRIPGRMFLNGATSMASLFTQQGRKGINQDAMIVWENFGSRMDTIFCGVFDGHGPFGHMVARKVRDSLPLKLSAHWEVNANCDDAREKGSSAVESITVDEFASVYIEEELRNTLDSKEKGKQPDIFVTLKESFLKAFKVMDKELRVHPSIDCFCSGTTAVTLIKQGQDLIIGNVGDSRAILGTRDQDNCLIAVQLTVDLKPDLPSIRIPLHFVDNSLFHLKLYFSQNLIIKLNCSLCEDDLKMKEKPIYAFIPGIPSQQLQHHISVENMLL